jgi:hypothetical protein
MSGYADDVSSGPFGQTVTSLFRIREVPSLNLDPDVDYSDKYFVTFLMHTRYMPV